MNENPETRNEDTLDTLRSSIELEHRFRTSLKGYNRQEVQNYLQSLNTEFRTVLAEREQEISALKAENTELYTALDNQRGKLENLRSEERRKLQLEYDMQEGLLERLREENARLLSENRQKQMEITDLSEQLTAFRALGEERSRQMDALGDRLEELLDAKLRECGDIISAWKTEFNGVVESESRQVSAP